MGKQITMMPTPIIGPDGKVQIVQVPAVFEVEQKIDHEKGTVTIRATLKPAN